MTEEIQDDLDLRQENAELDIDRDQEYEEYLRCRREEASYSRDLM